MPFPGTPLPELRPLLLSILNARDDDAPIENLARLSHKMAMAFLAGRVRRGLLDLSWNGLSVPDLAYDCIGELFQRDETGKVSRIISYFSGLDVTHSTDAELVIHLRRLVMSAVNQGLFRVYQDYDPSLAKIIRNVKIAIRALDNFSETEKFGETYISPTLCATLEHLPPLDRHALVEALQSLVSGSERIPDLLARLSLFLRTQETHARMVPLVPLALAFRDLYDLKNTRLISPVVTQSDIMIDIERAIKRTCDHIKTYAMKSYGSRGKLTAEVLNAYVAAIDSMLTHKLVLQDSRNTTLYAELKKSIPSLSVAQYRKIHRARLEYLSRLANKAITRELEM